MLINLKGIFLILVVLISINIVGTTNKTYETNNSTINYYDSISSYNTTVPLNIVNNTDFLAQAHLNNWTGNGTKNDPFIIQNYLFRTLYPNTCPNCLQIYYGNAPGLVITNVNYYFIIKHNFFSNTFIGNTFPSGPQTQYLIQIQNSANGLIEDNLFIENGTIFSTALGIDMESSTNVVFKNNTFYMEHNFGLNAYTFPAFSGVSVITDSNCVFQQNTFTNFQVKITAGINILLTGNTFINSPIHIITSTTMISYNQITNSNYGIYINIEGYLGGYLSLRKGSIIKNNLFLNNSYGIFLLRANILASDYIVCPGYLECSELPSEYAGFAILHYGNNIIRNNEFVNNTDKAIYIDQHNDNNTIYENDFINNSQSKLNILNSMGQFTTQVFENPNQNITNNWSLNEKGNYWSDYNYKKNSNNSIGQVPMIIGQNITDPYPIISPINNNYIYKPSTPQNYDLYITAGLVSIAMLTLVLYYVKVERKKKKELKGSTVSDKNYNQTINSKKQLNGSVENQRNENDSNQQPYKTNEKLSDKTIELLEEIIKENEQ